MVGLPEHDLDPTANVTGVTGPFEQSIRLNSIGVFHATWRSWLRSRLSTEVKAEKSVTSRWQGADVTDFLAWSSVLSLDLNQLLVTRHTAVSFAVLLWFLRSIGSATMVATWKKLAWGKGKQASERSQKKKVSVGVPCMIRRSPSMIACLRRREPIARRSHKMTAKDAAVVRTTRSWLRSKLSMQKRRPKSRLHLDGKPPTDLPKIVLDLPLEGLTRLGQPWFSKVEEASEWQRKAVCEVAPTCWTGISSATISKASWLADRTWRRRSPGRDSRNDPALDDCKPPFPCLYCKYNAPNAPDNPQIQPGTNWKRAYSRTCFYGLRRILHHGVLLESTDEEKGHHFRQPGLCLTPCLDQCIWFARPHTLPSRPLFHRAIIEVEYVPARATESRPREYVFTIQAEEEDVFSKSNLRRACSGTFPNSDCTQAYTLER